ncbi:hypothetical protein BUALT_Bualt03G0005800 [Buddleja alternifolia]|uniref:Thioredoxin domain-containing protein n=1 Tax=Buddleja alternifolia TaxID=168488 RepID=A0AAV6Y1D5_9LAMI|nr:hypothetical protein BUALT_Bualt03G0005800 [Buddleja alternifolia]
MRGVTVMLRRLISGRTPSIAARSSSMSENLILSSVAAASYSTLILDDYRTCPLFISPIAPRPSTDLQSFLLNHYRSFSSPPSSGPSLSLSLYIYTHTHTHNHGDILDYRDVLGPVLIVTWIADASKVVSIESEEQFNDSLRKVQDESLPAIFYFTAVWCGPCRLLSPVIAQLSEKYPHVTTYKIDIDKEGLGNALSKLNVHSVPTLHFFQNGKKASEVIGADVQRLKDTMEALYK